jgi:hypothetical protein
LANGYSNRPGVEISACHVAHSRDFPINSFTPDLSPAISPRSFFSFTGFMDEDGSGGLMDE